FHDYSAQNIFCLTLGTGIGGAFYNKYSQLYNGGRNRANEIGYLLFDRQTNNTFEQRASTTDLKTLMLEKGFIYQDNVAKLFELADQQDNLALSILNRWSDSIAYGISYIQIIFDHGFIMIGGGVYSQGHNLL